MPLLEVSDAKRAANLANAKHSTGPRSPEGKEKSRQNAVRHGLRSKLAVIEKLGETVQSNYVLKDLYLKRVNPGTPEELFFCEVLFKQHLNLRRVARWEAEAAEADPSANAPGALYLAAQRLETSIQNNYIKAQKQLSNLRSQYIFKDRDFEWPDEQQVVEQAENLLAAEEPPQNTTIEPTTPVESIEPEAPPAHAPVIPIDRLTVFSPESPETPPEDAVL